MKYIYYFLMLGLFILASCNNNEDVFEKDNAAPIVNYKGENSSEYSNKAHDSIKLSRQYYDLLYKIEDEENKALKIVTDLKYEVEKDTRSGKIRLAFDKTGEYIVTISYTDSWGVKDIMNYKLFVFDNLPPISKLAVTMITKYEWLLDASKSYDTDAQQKGGIAIYRYFVNKKEIDKTYQSSIRYVFQEKGVYEIGVQVKDNDQEWSEITYQTIKIE